MQVTKMGDLRGCRERILTRMDDIRFALPVDNEPGYRLEELPAFLQSNNRVKVRQAYNGDLVELISQEETLRFPIKYRRDITAACLWMIFHFVRFFAPRGDGPRCRRR